MHGCLVHWLVWLLGVNNNVIDIWLRKKKLRWSTAGSLCVFACCNCWQIYCYVDLYMAISISIVQGWRKRKDKIQMYLWNELKSILALLEYWHHMHIIRKNKKETADNLSSNPTKRNYFSSKWWFPMHSCSKLKCFIHLLQPFASALKWSSPSPPVTFPLQNSLLLPTLPHASSICSQFLAGSWNFQWFCSITIYSLVSYVCMINIKIFF